MTRRQEPDLRGALLDRHCVAALAHDVGPAVTAGLIDRFVSLLLVRTARIRRASVTGDAAELRVAVLGLCTSAAMLGAHRLAGAAERIASPETSGDTTWVELERVARQTVTALRAARPALGDSSGCR